jgi:hypothetical protein
MNLEQKLHALKQAASKPRQDSDLARQLEYLRRMEQTPKILPAQRAGKGIEHYVDGSVESNAHGEFFSAKRSPSAGLTEK